MTTQEKNEQEAMRLTDSVLDRFNAGELTKERMIFLIREIQSKGAEKGVPPVEAAQT